MEANSCLFVWLVVRVRYKTNNKTEATKQDAAAKSTDTHMPVSRLLLFVYLLLVGSFRGWQGRPALPATVDHPSPAPCFYSHNHPAGRRLCGSHVRARWFQLCEVGRKNSFFFQHLHFMWRNATYCCSSLKRTTNKNERYMCVCCLHSECEMSALGFLLNSLKIVHI